jgi:LPXTG-site transpeptidase (sortase) family protein
MNKRRYVLLVGLVAFSLTGCINPVRESTATEIPTRTPSTTLSENVIIDDKEQKEGYVTFWFDDGLSSTYEIAYPLLTEKGWKAVTAVISNREVAQEKFDPDGDPVMTWDQVKELVDSGWEISSHTRTHPRLNEITEIEKLRDEIIGSKEDLEKMNFQVHSFTYPYGQNGRQSGQEMISDNYLYWRSSLKKINPVPAWRHLTSFAISEEVEKEDLEKWVEETKERNGWLVITLHGIVDNPVNTRDQFNMVLNVVENSSLEVVLPYEMYKTFGYAEGETPILSKNEVVDFNTIGTDSFQEGVSLSIPDLGIDSKLKLVCEENNEYDFSVLHEAPIWICPEASPYLTDIGDYGASIILGHRQWGPVPKIFAELDLLHEENMVTIKDTETSVDFTVIQTAEIYPDDLWEEIARYHVQGIEKNRSFLILITCTPYGTDQMRLLVILERSNYETAYNMGNRSST